MNSYPTTCRTRTHARAHGAPERRTLELHKVWRPESRTLQHITCRRGRCWVTRSGDRQDYLLEPGMSFAVRACERVVFQALAEGTLLEIEESAPAQR